MLTVILVSDGSAANDHGSYGWVLGLLDGTRLAHGYGIVFEHDPSLYGAEGYGAKAGVLFLLHHFKYSTIVLPTADSDNGFKFYCNNKGLLKKFAVFCKYPNTGQSQVLTF
jgi:hypothetical protein